MAKTILLTGAAGFIGFHTAQALLARGDAVVGIDNLNDYYDPQLKRDRLAKVQDVPGFHFYEADICDQARMAEIAAAHGPDQICHLAAQAGVRYSLENPLAYIKSNVEGTAVVFELARNLGHTHLVYASSSSVYGNNPNPPFAEDAPTDAPISLYAATKKSCELIAHTYFHLFGIQSSGLRFFTVYGPWGRPDMMPIKFAKAILAGTPIDVYNYGKMRRDFTYVDDIVSGILASLDTPLGYQVINLGGNQPVELLSAVEAFEKHLGIPARKNLLPLQPGDVLMTAADTKKAESLLGWTAKVPLDEGVASFCSWFKEYYHA